MGIYRLILAMLVAMDHVGVRFWDYHLGVTAVISFFVISGYGMAMLVRKHYDRPERVWTFYLERCVRVFPHYLFYAAAATAALLVFPIESPFTDGLTLPKWILNLFVLPLGYKRLFDLYAASVIPQAWSLGLEFTFYLAIPWILLARSRALFYGLAAVSFLFFVAAYTGRLDTDLFGYRLLPGTLFMFLAGASFADSDGLAARFRIVVVGAAIALLAYARWHGTYYTLQYNKEVLLGVVVAVAAVALLRRTRFSELDEYLGNLSYGVFLNHMLVIWLMQSCFGIRVFEATHVATLLAASSLLALVSCAIVERPARRWRRSIRYGEGTTRGVVQGLFQASEFPNVRRGEDASAGATS